MTWWEACCVCACYENNFTVWWIWTGTVCWELHSRDAHLNTLEHTNKNHPHCRFVTSLLITSGRVVLCVFFLCHAASADHVSSIMQWFSNWGWNTLRGLPVDIVKKFSIYCRESLVFSLHVNYLHCYEHTVKNIQSYLFFESLRQSELNNLGFYELMGTHLGNFVNPYLGALFVWAGFCHDYWRTGAFLFWNNTEEVFALFTLTLP